MIESDEYSFVAFYDKDSKRLTVTDNQGGGRDFTAFTREDVVNAVVQYIQSSAYMIGEYISGDVYGLDSEDDYAEV